MKNYQIQVILVIALFVILQGGCKFQEKDSVKNESPRLAAVRTFADNVLGKGLDKWSGENTPLLANGINIDTEKPVEWIYNGKHYIIHNLANQQNLFRTLVGLSNLTGEEKYRNAAKEAFRFHFDHLRSKCGLLRWGGHQMIDLQTLKPVGDFDANCHELKNNFPYYELMWEVDSTATADFIRAFWNAHIYDWTILDMNRHGKYGLNIGKLWNSKFSQAEPFFEGRGLTFINVGSDLIFSGAMLYCLKHEEGALKWAKRLADQYVRARHPLTGLGVVQYSKPIRQKQPTDDTILTFSYYGDRAENQFGKDFPGVAREGWELFYGRTYTLPALIQLEIAERLGEKGEAFLKNTIDGMKAYARYAYNPDDNQFRPMWADGTDLTNYRFKHSGYYGPKGKELKPTLANEQYLFSYSRAYRLSKNEHLWEVLRSMFKGLNLGDPGIKPDGTPNLNLKTNNSNAYTLFAILEISRVINNHDYLQLAEVIGNNILARSFHSGYFLPDKDHINCNFNAIEPLALLSLEAALRGNPKLVPVYSGGRGYIHGQFDGMGRTTDGQAIWSEERVTIQS